MNTTYPNSLTDTEWDYLQRLLPPRSARSKLRRHSLRSVVDALFYLVRTGCPWCYLPAQVPPWQTVNYRFHCWKREGFWAQIRTILLS
jgi:putative transposase